MRRLILIMAIPMLVLCSFTCNKHDQQEESQLSGCNATFVRKQASSMSAKLYYVTTKGWMVDIIFVADNQGYRAVICNQSDPQLLVAIQGLATDGTRYDVTVSGKIRDSIDNQGTQTPGAGYPVPYYITLEAITK